MNTTVEVEQEVEQEILARMPKPSELINLLSTFSEEERKKIGEQVVTSFKIDNESRKQWIDNVVKDLMLFTAFREPKTYPWKDASNVILPFLSIAILQYQARAYEALVPSKDIIGVFDPGGTNVVEGRAERIKKHMNYQLLYQMEEFEEGMDRSLFQQPLVGCAIRKTYFSKEEVRNISEDCSAEDLVVSYSYKGSIEKCRRKTQILRVPIDTVKRRVISGEYLPIKAESLFFANSQQSELSTPIQDKVDQIMGIAKPTTSEFDDLRVILEQHTWYDIDKNGLQDPVVITVDLETMEVLRISDRRFLDFYGKSKIIEYYTKYPFIPNSEGFYDFGFGTLLRGLNESANTIINEVIDAGHLANLTGGFVSKRSGIKKGNLSFKMGEFKEVDTSLDDISKALYEVKFKGPDQTLYAVLGLLFEYNKLVTGVSETMVGNMPSSDTPGVTILALIEEGKKVFSSIHKRNHRSFKKESRKLFRLNSVFLNDEEYFRILDEHNIPSGDRLPIGRMDYVDDFDVFPASDPNMLSRSEQILQAKEVYELTLTSPVTANNMVNIYEAQLRFYKALNVPNISQILTMPTPVDKAAEEENADFLQDKPSTVTAEQDHNYHIVKHNELKTGVFAEQLSPDAVNMMNSHIKEHVAQVYLMDEIRKQQEANANALEAKASASRLN